MLHLGDDDFIAGRAHLAERVGYQIDRLGRTASENDLPFGRRIEKTAHIAARALKGLGGLVGQGVQPAMHIGIGGSIDA